MDPGNPTRISSFCSCDETQMTVYMMIIAVKRNLATMDVLIININIIVRIFVNGIKEFLYIGLLSLWVAHFWTRPTSPFYQLFNFTDLGSSRSMPRLLIMRINYQFSSYLQINKILVDSVKIFINFLTLTVINKLYMSRMTLGIDAKVNCPSDFYCILYFNYSFRICINFHMILFCSKPSSAHS